DLQADGQVDSGAEGSADCSWGEAQVLEELGEGLGEDQTRAFLSHNHTTPHTRQIHTPRLHTHTNTHTNTNTHTHTHKPNQQYCLCVYVTYQGSFLRGSVQHALQGVGT